MSKSMTFEELRAAIDKLTPEQLNMPVLWTGEERGGSIGGVEILTEEHVDIGEGLEPKSSYEDIDITKDDVLASYPAGTVFLTSDV